MGDTKVSIFGAGGVGFHLTLNAPPADAPSVARYRAIMQPFLQHGLRLGDKDLESLRAGRDEGVAAINRVMNATAGPVLGRKACMQLSEELANLLMKSSLTAQLSREAPTTAERLQQREAVDRFLLDQPKGPTRQGTVGSLLQQVPIGVSLTVHF